jgi:two-component system, NtrC family, response regulator GlrR
MLRGVEDRTHTAERIGQSEALGAIVRVLNAPAVPSEFPLLEGRCRLGAGNDADVVIADSTVSRLHAELTLVPEGVLVTDLQSRNGSHYLGHLFHQMTLGLGSQFRIGKTEIAVDVDRRGLESAAPVELTSYGRLIGVSTPMRRLFAQLLRLESTLATVLIQGESGTGKELVARALHDHSRLASGPFLAVNCGALDRALVRSELFGHEKGAFTGAVRTQIGAFEAADGGTLFLDEVGELPLEIQPVLLRALETGSVVRIGESLERKIKLRLIAATNRDLASEVEAGRFRKDLYYRLAVVKLGVPALRERPDDVEALSRHLAEELELRDLPPELLMDLRSRPFPGNVRELRNALEAFNALGTLSCSLPAEDNELEVILRKSLDITRPYADQKEAVLRTFQRVYIKSLLERTQGNQSEAARISGLERSYLNRLVGKLPDG